MSDSKVALIAGYGIGISAGVAKKFGAEGYKVALLARTQSRLDEASADLKQQGITAKGYSTDLSNVAAIKATVAAVHNDFGPISLIFWNPYAAGSGAHGFWNTPTEDFQISYDVSVTGLVTAIQAAHEDLKATKGLILVTGAGSALENDDLIPFVIDKDMITMVVPKAAQRKLVHILNKELLKDGIYMAEVTVCTVVKGTWWDPEGKAPLTSEAIADRFWEVAQKRDPSVWFVTIP